MLLQTVPVTTANKVVSVNGKVFYNDRRRRIDLKRPIRDLFEKENVDVFYQMELCLSLETTLKRVNQLSQENVVPILLYFVVKK